MRKTGLPKEVIRPSKDQLVFPVPPSKDPWPEGLGKIGVRQSRILSALDKSEGAIEGPSFSSKVTEILSEHGVETSGYSRAITSTTENGFTYVEESKDREHLVMTPDGYVVAALIKAYPEKIAKTKEILRQDTAFKIIEYILNEAHEVDEEGVHWLLPKGSYNIAVMDDVALGIGLGFEAVYRRGTSLKNDKQYLCAEYDSTEERPHMTNVGVTPAGEAYYKRVLEHVQPKALKEIKIIKDIENLGLNVIDIVASSEDKELLKRVMTMCSAYDLTNMSKPELLERRSELEELIILLGLQK